MIQRGISADNFNNFVKEVNKNIPIIPKGPSRQQRKKPRMRKHSHRLSARDSWMTVTRF